MAGKGAVATGLGCNNLPGTRFSQWGTEGRGKRSADLQDNWVLRFLEVQSRSGTFAAALATLLTCATPRSEWPCPRTKLKAKIPP